MDKRACHVLTFLLQWPLMLSGIMPARPAEWLWPLALATCTAVGNPCHAHISATLGLRVTGKYSSHFVPAFCCVLWFQKHMHLDQTHSESLLSFQSLSQGFRSPTDTVPQSVFGLLESSLGHGSDKGQAVGMLPGFCSQPKLPLCQTPH